jgi:hypothetical protein
MAKRPRKPPPPFKKTVIDAGEYGERGEVINPGGQFFVTEGGERLTMDEAYRRRDEAGVGGPKGMAAATIARAIALACFYNEVGLDPHDPDIDNASALAQRLADYAKQRGIPNAGLLAPEGGSLRGLMRAFADFLKAG